MHTDIEAVIDFLNYWSALQPWILGFARADESTFNNGIEVTSGTNPLWIASFYWSRDGQDWHLEFTEGATGCNAGYLPELAAISTVLAGFCID